MEAAQSLSPHVFSGVVAMCVGVLLLLLLLPSVDMNNSHLHRGYDSRLWKGVVVPRLHLPLESFMIESEMYCNRGVLMWVLAWVLFVRLLWLFLFVCCCFYD